MQTSTNILSCSSSRITQPIRGACLTFVIALSFMSDSSWFDRRVALNCPPPLFYRTPEACRGFDSARSVMRQ